MRTTTKLRVTSMVLAVGLATIWVGLASPYQARAQAQGQEQAKGEEVPRKAKLKVEPPNGTVKSAKPVGGHPLLVNAATDAVRRWRFEPGPGETNGIVEFKFQPQY